MGQSDRYYVKHGISKRTGRTG